MALFKEKINNAGVTTNYHRIGIVSLNSNQLDISLESYVSKEYRESNHSVDSRFFHFDITVEEEESMGIRQLCYSKIKELEDWNDSVDC